MELILLERIRNLGDLGALVDVKPGYARNFLIPQGKALPATAEAKAEFERRKADLEQAEAKAQAEAQERATKFEGVTLTVTARASEEGKLYGSVGPSEIAEAAIAQGLELEASEVDMTEGAIHDLGEHHATLQLHPKVEVVITIAVNEEVGEA